MGGGYIQPAAMRGVPPASRHLLCRGLVVLVRLDLLYLGQSVQPPHDPTEDRMLTVEVRGALVRVTR